MFTSHAALGQDDAPPAWFSVNLMQKDLRLARGTARDLQVPLPTGEAAGRVLDAAGRAGHGADDITSVFAALAHPAEDAAVA